MKTVVAGALGECVHVAGVSNFLHLAEAAGYRTVFLGPAVPVEQFIQAVRAELAEVAPADLLVGVSYRLTPETGERLLGEFAEAADELYRQGVRFAFGGTPPVAERAAALGFFERLFDGSQEGDQVLAYLKETPESVGYGGIDIKAYPQSTIERIDWKSPFPLIRHHFGLPTMEATRQGIEQIAAAGVLDVISLGIDQDAQENFFHPERQDPRRTGAGGVPVRTPADYRNLYADSRTGNYPLLRVYSGTDDFLRLAQMYVETLNNAWCAIPLFWFNRMDGRGPWDLAGSIQQHQQVMAWYGGRGIPVELNEPHHWGMRDAPDVVCVVSAYLSAYNARAFGVQDYIAQLMFNSPPGLSDAMDLAKMLAILDLIAPLAGDDFRIWRQTRTGLLSYPLDPTAARAHLATSVYVQMALRPHIVHVVGHTEAHHAASADDVIEACKLARRAIENALAGELDSPRQGRGLPRQGWGLPREGWGLPREGRDQPRWSERGMCADPVVQRRRQELVSEAGVTLEAIRRIAGSAKGGVDRAEGGTSPAEGGGAIETLDPFTDPATLERAVTSGILDAPQLKNNPYGRGAVVTRIVGGTCLAVDLAGKPLSEEARLKSI